MSAWPDAMQLSAHLRGLEVPLRHGDISFFLAEKVDSARFDAADADLLVLFAPQAEIAIANAAPTGTNGAHGPTSRRWWRPPHRGVVVFHAATCGAAQRRPRGAPHLRRAAPVAAPGGGAARRAVLPPRRRPALNSRFRTDAACACWSTSRRSGTRRARSRRLVAAVQDLAPLEELQRQRAEFLAMVGQELRAPLTSIKGSTTTLLGAADHITLVHCAKNELN